MEAISELQKNVDFMKDEDSWPLWPRLPLKRRGTYEPGRHMAGLLLAGRGPKVYLVNMYADVDLRDVDAMEYSDYEALVEDGWRVD